MHSTFFNALRIYVSGILLFALTSLAMPLQAQSLVGNKTLCIEDLSGTCGPLTNQALVGDIGRYSFTVDNTFGTAVFPYMVTEQFSPDFNPYGPSPIECFDLNNSNQPFTNFNVHF